MKRTQITKIAKLSEEQYQELMNNGSVVIDGKTLTKEDYPLVFTPGGGGLYLHQLQLIRWASMSDTNNKYYIINVDVYSSSPAKMEYERFTSALIGDGYTKLTELIKILPKGQLLPARYDAYYSPHAQQPTEYVNRYMIGQGYFDDYASFMFTGQSGTEEEHIFEQATNFESGVVELKDNVIAL